MNRRAILVAAAAISLILAPSAATAYAASVPAGVSLPVTDAKPAAGVPFNVKASGAKANEAVTLTITREPASSGKPPAPAPATLTKNANAKGTVSFAVRLTEDGTYSLVSTSASGALLGSQSVTVSDHGAVIVAGESASASVAARPRTAVSPRAAGAPAAGSSARAPTAGSATAGTSAVGSRAAGVTAEGRLAFTGVRGLGLAGGGGALVLAGAGLILVARPRRPAYACA